VERDLDYLVQTRNKEIDTCMAMRAQVMGLTGGRRELLLPPSRRSSPTPSSSSHRSFSWARAPDQARPCGQASAGASAARASSSPPRLHVAVELRGRPWRHAPSSATVPRPAMVARVELHLSHGVLRCAQLNRARRPG
jgi:hypothetical protein